MFLKKWFPVLLLVVAFLLPSILYLTSETFLGYDSYYFLAEVCGGNPVYNATINAPLHNALLSLLPCNDFLLKLMIIGLFGLAMLTIYAIGEDYNKGWGVTTTLFAMVSPILLYNSFKFENDAFAFPILFLATYFFLKHLKFKKNYSWSDWPTTTFREKYQNLMITIFLFLFSLGWWGGGIYLLIMFTFFEPLLLIITLPLFIIFSNAILGPIIPNLNVNENNFLQGSFTMIFYIFFLIFPKNKKVFEFPFRRLTLVTIAFGLINPKFMILALPFIGLALAHAYSIAKDVGKQKMMLFATIFIIGFSLPIGLGTLHPSVIEHDAIQDLIELSVVEDKNLFNDWSYGHMVYYYGAESNQYATYHRRLNPEEDDYTDSVVLTRFDLNCFLVKQYDKPILTSPLKLYEC